MIVQIYEIQTPEEAEICIEKGVDHIGSVILSEDDWCQPILREAIRVSDGTGAKSSLIPLFQGDDNLYRAVDYYKPRFVHFCESLTDDQRKEIDLERFILRQATLKERFPEIGIIRSIPIPEEGSASQFPSLRIAGRLEPVSDLFLIDTWLGNGPVKGYIGITGRTCDRDTAGKLVGQSSIPVILGGGLSPENVFEALMVVQPSGADSCTQTNRMDKKGNPIRFRKDFKKVERFVDEVRRVERVRKIH